MTGPEDRTAEPWARFDDFTGAGGSFELRDPSCILAARRLSEVTAVIEGAEAAAREGLWVAGFVGYDAAPGLDGRHRVRDREPGDPMGSLPLAWFGAFRRRLPLSGDRPSLPAGPPPSWALEWDRHRHAEAVGRVKDLIAEGLTYQVNLTARARAAVPDPLGLYRSFVDAQQGAYNAFVHTGAHAVACASPELFFELTGDRLLTRPMKGTARRGRWSEEDTGAAAALRSSAKDHAENVMIVDLLRNDVGRIALTGSVRVEALAAVERYPTVWQLTSTVTGMLPPKTSLVEVFRALFPSGSVTGAPKVRTMEAIAELESSARGVYCGALGFITPGRGAPGRGAPGRGAPRTARFAVAIRTATVDLATGCAEYGAGGGITWPSDPDAEWDELSAKMAILDRAATPDGLFETMRCDPATGLVNLERHLHRLAASAAYFAIPYDDRVARSTLKAVAGACVVPQRVRLVLSRAGDLAATASVHPDPPTAPVRLGLAVETIDSDDAWMFHKTVDRERYDRRLRGRTDVDDVILWNTRGQLTETTIANLVLEIEGTWWTPPLDCGLLPGVERARLIDERAVRERILTVADLDRATAIAVVSSLRGWRPAVRRP